MLVCPEGHESEASDYCDTCGAPMGAGPTPSPASPGASAQGAGPAAAGSALDLEPVAATQECPHCTALNLLDAFFCEACGYDFTTGALPLGSEPEPEPEPEPMVEPEPLADVQPDAAPAPPVEVEPAPAPAPPVEVEPVSEPELEPAEARPEEARPEPAGHVKPRHTPPSRYLDDTWVVEIWIDPDWYEVQQTQEACPSAGMPELVPVRRNVVHIGRPSGRLGGRPEVDAGSDSAVSRRHAQLTSDGRRWWIEDLGSSNGTFVGVVGDPLPTTPLTQGQKLEIDRDDRIYVGAWTRLVLRQAIESEIRGRGHG